MSRMSNHVIKLEEAVAEAQMRGASTLEEIFLYVVDRVITTRDEIGFIMDMWHGNSH
jgi:hypothetical protein